MTRLTGLVGLVGSLCLACALTGCPGGGGDGGSGTPAPSTATPVPTVVSGSVQAPAGQIAFFKESTTGDLFVSDAYAALTGLAPVSDHTIVQLARLNTNANGFAVITTTVTSGGRYSFDLTALGLQPANDLIVRVAGLGGKEMRAFLIGTVVDVNPVSEAGYQLAVDALSGRPVNNLTLQEISDISGAVATIGALEDLGLAVSLDQAVNAVKARVNADTQVSSFVIAASAVGQTDVGTGDVGNYFPLDEGQVSRLQGFKMETGRESFNYSNQLMVFGSKDISGVSTRTLLETNPEGAATPLEHYVVKGVLGITSYGDSDSTDTLSSQLSPYRSLRFPITAGTSYQTLNKAGLSLGQDLDGDGKSESVNVKVTVHVLGSESVTVPAGIFPLSWKVQTTTILTIVGSMKGDSVDLLERETMWLVSGYGPVKIVDTTEAEGFRGSITEELVEFIPAFRFVSITVEKLNGCGLLESGKAYCWGWNGDGQVGAGLSSSQFQTPMPVAGNLTFAFIYAGCGIARGGQAYCWGRNDFGQLGNGTFTGTLSPVPVSGGINFSTINSPYATTCGIASTGKAYCWGANSSGSFGNGSSAPSGVPVPVAGDLTFVSIASSGDTVCGVTSAGAGYCWGDNGAGQLGNGSKVNSNIPVPVSGGHMFSLIRIGIANACGLTTTGDAYCWGQNVNGAYGNGTTTSSTIPVPAANGLKFMTLDAGADYYCGLTAAGAAYCWGLGGQGQLGNGTVGQSSIPVPVAGEHSFVSISAGQAVCALTSEGAAYCWGPNDSGQLGNSSAYPQSTIPVRVFPPTS